MNRLQPQILVIWRILLTLLAVAPSFLISLLFRIGTVPWICAAAFIAALYIVGYAVYLPMLFKKISFGLSGGRLIYSTGVITSRVISVPIPVIRYVAVAQTPLGRIFGLASVVVTAPGARLTIAGLKSTDADKLASALLEDIIDEGGE